MKQYRKDNPDKWIRTQEQKDKYNENRRKKYAENMEYRESIKKQVRVWQKNNPGKRKAQRLTTYDLTLDEFNSILEQQNYACAICGHTDMTDKNFFPVVDHDHNTNQVRGLLCMNCNMGLGKFKDDVNLLYSAIAYIGGE